MDQVGACLKNKGEHEDHQDKDRNGKNLHFFKQPGYGMIESLPLFEQDPQEDEKDNKGDGLSQLVREHKGTKKDEEGDLHSYDQNCFPYSIAPRHLQNPKISILNFEFRKRREPPHLNQEPDIVCHCEHPKDAWQSPEMMRLLRLRLAMTTKNRSAYHLIPNSPFHNPHSLPAGRRNRLRLSHRPSLP
jgi:hypothetical protein